MDSLRDAVAQAVAGMGLSEETDPTPTTGTSEETETTDTEAATEDGTEETEAQDGDQDTEDEGEEDSEAEEPGDAVELSPDQTVIIDGKKVLVKDALEIKANYTKKTQELAELRRETEERQAQVQETYTELNEWFQSMEQNPTGFLVQAIKSDKVDFADALSTLADQLGLDPSEAVSLYFANEFKKGALSDDMVEAFGLSNEGHAIHRKASETQTTRRLAALEEERKAEKEAAQRAIDEATTITQRQAALEQMYQTQFEAIIRDNNLGFAADSPEAAALQIKLIEFVKSSGRKAFKEDLEAAYENMVLKEAQEAQAAKRKQAALTEQKKGVSKIAKSSASPKVSSPASGAKDMRSAVQQAMAEKLGIQR